MRWDISLIEVGIDLLGGKEHQAPAPDERNLALGFLVLDLTGRPAGEVHQLALGQVGLGRGSLKGVWQVAQQGGLDGLVHSRIEFIFRRNENRVHRAFVLGLRSDAR